MIFPGGGWALAIERRGGMPDPENSLFVIVFYCYQSSRQEQLAWEPVDLNTSGLCPCPPLSLALGTRPSQGLKLL